MSAQAILESHPVVAFTEPDSVECTKLQSLFGELAIPLHSVELDGSATGLREEVSVLAQQRAQLPAVFVKQQYIGALNEGPEPWMGVTRLLATGKLHQLIQGDTTVQAIATEGSGLVKLATPTEFDFDLVVIGGGSGGLACAREAATDTNKKVAVFDFVKPSPQGSTWDIGGTCVNVGCIPKKLMHTAAIHGEAHHDAQHFGWKTQQKQTHDWGTMVANVQKHIQSLNSGAKSSLRKKDVTYFNALGSFVGPHTIRATYGDGSTKDITAHNVVIAVGGRPTPLPNCVGSEHAIDSDDIFALKKSPGKILCIGASYVALECAGFLTGLGYDTTVMVRSILLRGFDQDCANRICAVMQYNGTQFIRSATPSKIEKLSDGRFKVYWRNANTKNNPELPPGSEGSEIFDTVFSAVGRKADVSGLNLAAAGVELNKWGKFPGNGRPGERESTNVPHIYALGDCLEGVPELTPAAIQAGQFLARRLFKGSTRQMPYNGVATTVFTPLEYGCVGVSEDDVRVSNNTLESEKAYTQALDQTYRYSQLKPGFKVHSKTFTPLEWTVTPNRPRGACYIKVICQGDNDQLVGIHYCGPNAGEVLQGFSLAVKLGATYDDLRTTIGIHPTCAEMLTLVESKQTAATAEPKEATVALDFSLASNPNGDVVDEVAGGVKDSDTSPTEGMKFDFSLDTNPDGMVALETPAPAPKFDFFGASAGGDEECAT